MKEKEEEEAVEPPTERKRKTKKERSSVANADVKKTKTFSENIKALKGHKKNSS